MDIPSTILRFRHCIFSLLIVIVIGLSASSWAQSNNEAVESASDTSRELSAASETPKLSKRQLKKQQRKEARTVYVIEPFANMHTGPGRGFPVVHVLEKNDTAVILKQRTNWLKVETRKGHIGWVNRSIFQAAFTPKGEPIVFERSSKEAFLNRTFEFGLLGGNFEGASSFTNYVAYHFTKNISGELTYSQSFGNFSNRKLASINIVHQMYPNWRVSPFFKLGTGIIQTSPDADLAQSQDREDNTISAGGGVFVKVSKRFLIRIEYDNHTVLTTRENNEEVEEWKVGFGVYF